MVRVDMLKESIIAHNKTVGDVASTLGIDRSTFYRKMEKNGDNFTVKQAQEIGDYLGLTQNEFSDIFFAK